MATARGVAHGIKPCTRPLPVQTRSLGHKTSLQRRTFLKGVPLVHALQVAHVPVQRCRAPRAGSREDRGRGGHVNRLKLTRKVVGSALVGGLAGLNVLLSPANAASLTITYPGSHVDEVSAVQRALVEAWGIVRSTFVDPTYNHQDWDGLLDGTLAESVKATDADSAYSSIRSMLGVLGDPFTRIVTPKEYAQFRINNDGALDGVGLLIASDPGTGRMVVLHPIEGGPASRAGIRPGDELVMVNGADLQGLNSEQAASLLRGRKGTSVRLKLRSATASIQSDAPLVREVKLERETIVISPVFATLLPHVSPSGSRTGYIRLTSFSQNAAADMERAIDDLEKQGADSYILDLRNNPGGLVKAGLEVAEMWLDTSKEQATLVNTTDRDGDLQPIVAVGGKPLTRDPLVILVNNGSASASEILAGALHDNHRATLVGEQTYGKGRIQSVFELKDGSALFVTVAKYLSPDLHEIDKIGIAPDVKCSPNAVPLLEDPYMGTRGDKVVAARIEKDSCVKLAERELDRKHA